MAFSYDGSYLPRLINYAEAHSFWETALHWRGQDGESDGRVLDNKRKKYVTIRKLHDGSIACKLHRTDVITFHPDNTMTVRPWNSISTDEFFNSLIGHTHGMRAEFNTCLIQVQGRFYTAYDALKIDCANGRLLTEQPPFKIRTINRKKANEVRKLYNYQDFATWVRMLAAMGERPHIKTAWWTSATTLNLLSDRNSWPDLLRCANYEGVVDASGTLTRVREAIYLEHPEVYDVTVKPYLTSWKEVAQWKRS